MKTSEALKSASIRLVKQSEMLAAETDPTFTMIDDDDQLCEPCYGTSKAVAFGDYSNGFGEARIYLCADCLKAEKDAMADNS